MPTGQWVPSQQLHLLPLLSAKDNDEGGIPDESGWGHAGPGKGEGNYPMKE